MSVTQRGKHERKMIENTYLEQYITRARNVPDWLMESLKKLKDPKNERQIKKIHEFIDYVENKRGKLLLYQKVNIELMLINRNDKIIEVKGNMRSNAMNQSNKIQKLLGYVKVSTLQAMKNGYIVRCGNSLYEIRDGIIFKDGFPHELTAEEMTSEDWNI